MCSRIQDGARGGSSTEAYGVGAKMAANHEGEESSLGKSREKTKEDKDMKS